MSTRRIGTALLAALALVCGCVLYRQGKGWRDDVPRPVAPPRDEGPFDPKQLVGMKTDDAVRYAEGRGWRCQVVGGPAKPYAPPWDRRPRTPGAPDPWAVILLEEQDGKVTDATVAYELSGGQ
jgi:hypothetical protein